MFFLQGRHIAPMMFKFVWMNQQQVDPIDAGIKCWTPKIENWTQFLKINAPQCVSLGDFTKFSVCVWVCGVS